MGSSVGSSQNSERGYGSLKILENIVKILSQSRNQHALRFLFQGLPLVLDTHKHSFTKKDKNNTPRDIEAA